MKAIQYRSHGGPEVVQYEDIAVPKLAPGESLIRVQNAGVNFVDIYHRQGFYPVPLTFTPGIEGAGIVESEGGNLKPGTRVCWVMVPGAFAEYAAVPNWKLVPVPDFIDNHTAAAALSQGITAQYLCETTYVAKQRDYALVHAGAGGVGLILIQLLKKKGVTVLTTVSTPEKAALARAAGADETILYTETDFVEAVKKATNGKGVHVAYDAVGKTTYAGSMSLLRPLGTLVLYGQSSGPVPPIDPMELSKQGSIFLARPSLAHHIADPASLKERAGKILNWIKQGDLKLRIERVYPLADVAQAQIDLESRKTTGKLIIEIG